MKFPKKTRIKNQELIDFIKTLPCLICYMRPSDPDHITTRGAGGHDLADNLWPLCRKHHNERHSKGLGFMIKKYSSCKQWLIKANRKDILEKYEN
jgi:5-methylcytosine-specific restriction endonuclease McrA